MITYGGNNSVRGRDAYLQGIYYSQTVAIALSGGRVGSNGSWWANKEIFKIMEGLI